MKILWICALLAFYAYAEELDYDDYYYGSLEELDKLISEDEKPTNEKTDIENDLKVEEEIQQFRKADENSDAVDDPKDTIDAIDDYQFEDNRDKSKENVDDKDNTNNSDKLESNNELEHSAQEDDNVENRPEDHNQNADYALLWGDDNIAPLPVPDEINNDDNEAILEETKNILEEEDADKFEDEIKDQFGNLDINEETRKLLEEEDADKFEDDIKAQIGEKDSKENNDDRETLKDFNNMLFGDDGINDNSEVKDLNANNDDSKLQGVGQEAIDNKYASEEDTVDKAYADLNADLDKLFETLDKLKDDGSDDKAIEEMEKQVDALFDSWEGDDLDENNMDGSDEFDDNPVDLDQLFSDILDDDDMKAEDVAVDDMDLINDEVNEPNPDDAFEKDAETFDTDMGRIIFGEDALVDTEQKDKDTEQNIENIENDKNNGFTAKAEDATPKPEEKEVKTALVDELNSAELDDLVSQFSILHSEDLDVHADSFDKNIAPIHITLKLDEPTLITSPGYPSPYPTNNIVDWILSGDGVGIELNITDFAVNGALGDYLLIKPGGVDESGHEGLLFTYRLTTERRYRFIDVDRAFMRFESKLGMMFNRGFSISAKMIAPLSERSEPVPEPEPVLSPPHSTSTVHLATTVLKFQDLKEQFTALLAEMADRYIQDYDVEPGLNSTSEVTKITSVHLCPVSWPNFEHCVAVTFGISLEYDDEDQSPRLNEQDLEDMWTKYIHEEPFVTRLAEMGLSEFDQPAAGVMTAWLALGAAVALATVALAFVLWRCSCLQDYTRMQSYPEDASEAGSKRALDLYPTPHQTLPPLYCESEYKWDGHTTVDMGGFANRSYATDNMYDFESDEDVGPNRDRKGAQNSRDVCNV